MITCKVVVTPVVYSSSVSESLTDIDPRPSEDEKLKLQNSEDDARTLRKMKMKMMRTSICPFGVT
jgi:hypothetical protein